MDILTTLPLVGQAVTVFAGEPDGRRRVLELPNWQIWVMGVGSWQQSALLIPKRGSSNGSEGGICRGTGIAAKEGGVGRTVVILIF